MTKPTEPTPTDCECMDWGRNGLTLLTGHHRHCPKYRIDAEGMRLLRNLLDGIEEWAADEDGVHWECWDAYRQACLALGRPVSLEEM